MGCFERGKEKMTDEIVPLNEKPVYTREEIEREYTPYLPLESSLVLWKDVVEAVEGFKKDISSKLNPSGDIDYDFIMEAIKNRFGL